MPLWRSQFSNLSLTFSQTQLLINCIPLKPFFQSFSYLHTEAGLGAGERENLDLDSLAFADNISDVSHAALSAQLGDVDQALPSFPTNKELNVWLDSRNNRQILVHNNTCVSFCV